MMPQNSRKQISKSQLDCEVALIFGHACAMILAGPYHNNEGMELVDGLWKIGYPVDLIPASEIDNVVYIRLKVTSSTSINK
jgi:hypothetical protein